MADFAEFKKVLNEFEKELKPECEDVFLVHSTFRDIRDMVESLIQNRDKRIKELEAKSSPKQAVTPVKENEPVEDKPKKECPLGKIVNPKTGRCINKPKEKTQKTRGRPKKTVSKETVKPTKECPPGKIINPKTGRCINKPKEKTQKTRGRPKKKSPERNYDWIGQSSSESYEPSPKPKKAANEILGVKMLGAQIVTDPKPEKEKVSNYHQKQYEKFMEKTKKDDLKEAFVEKSESSESEEETMYTRRKNKPRQPKSHVRTTATSQRTAFDEKLFDEALEYIRTTGKPGSYRTFLNGIKKKFGVTLKYDNHGDDYALPDLYFMKGGKECSREEMLKVKKYVIDTYRSKKANE
jgi:hypothetical protein